MRVAIGVDVFNDLSSFGEIDRILCLFEDEWHVWELEDPDAVENCAWLQVRPHWRKMFEESTRVSAYSVASALHRNVFKVSLAPGSGWHSPEVARKALSECVWVLMENRITDGEAFLSTVLDLLAPPVLKAFRSKVPPPIRYDSAGGNGELKKLVERYVDDPAWRGIPRRIVVFTDSDAKIAGKTSQQANDVRMCCLRRGVTCVVLSKRSIENYIPDVALESWVHRPGYDDLIERYQALGRLSPVQRDHYSMKDGFAQTCKGSRQMTKEEEELYASVSMDDRITLDEGFTSKIINCLRDYNTPSLPVSVLTDTVLNGRDGKGELMGLVDSILEKI